MLSFSFLFLNILRHLAKSCDTVVAKIAQENLRGVLKLYALITSQIN